MARPDKTGKEDAPKGLETDRWRNHTLHGSRCRSKAMILWTQQKGVPGNGLHTQNSGTHFTLAQCWNVVTGESGIARKKAPCNSEREHTRVRARFERARQSSGYIKTPCKLRNNGLHILGICSHPGLCCATATETKKQFAEQQCTGSVARPNLSNYAVPASEKSLAAYQRFSGAQAIWTHTVAHPASIQDAGCPHITITAVNLVQHHFCFLHSLVSFVLNNYPLAEKTKNKHK